MADKNATKNSGSSNKENKPNERLYHLIFVFGWGLLSGVLTVTALWPINHLAFFLALAALWALPIIWELHVRDISRDKIVLAVMSIFALAIFAYRVVGPISEPLKTISGSLQPGDWKTPTISCSPGTKIPPDMTKVFIGGNLAAANILPKPVPPWPLVMGNNGPVVSIQRTDDGISIDASIFGADGSAIATIKNNNFQAIVGNDLIADQPDLSSLEVHRGKRELLYVRFLNPNAILIRGFFASPGLMPVEATEDSLQSGKRRFRNNCFVGIPIMLFMFQPPTGG
jgi:hypothetical protein